MDNKTLRWIIILIILGLGGYALYNQSQIAEGAVKIGVTQITSHPVFDEINKGIVKAFEDAGYKEGIDVVFDFQNAQGDQTVNVSIAQKFASSDYDLFMPLGTPASQAVVNLIKERPIVFGAVTDPLSAGLVKSSEKPGANVTGTSDITLYKEHLELLKRLAPSARRLGVVYNPGEANARFALEQTRKEAGKLNMQVITAPANNTGEILGAARSIVRRVDAFYMLPDNTILAGQESLVKVALENKKPLIGIEQSSIEKGGLATLGTNYLMVGVRTGEIALRVLKGEDPGTIPVLGVTDADVFLNTKTADAIGVSLPEDLVKSAKQIYQ